MNWYLQFFVIVPFLAFVISFLLNEKNEKLISKVSIGFIFTQLLFTIFFTVKWIISDDISYNLKEITIIKTSHYEFFIDFFFDNVSAVYLLVGNILTYLVVRYSSIYLHREKGFKRFFNTILFFYLGYNITILSGNFETLFLGWEILGVSSFLLIAFYRERYLPVKNAIKVFSIYRIGDIGIILAMWGSHHLFHENITFSQFQNFDVISFHIKENYYFAIFISLCLVMAAATKSAQIPFSTWLPRAMEGPTPSSAIFYGSLSVHLGVFLLLRTFLFWENILFVRIAIVLMGLVTAIMANFMAKVQSSIKSQIAYSSVSQIGIIFIEIGLGLEYLALFHFVGNAFLRTFQLLISPSVVIYKIKEQFYNFIPKNHKIIKFNKLKNSIYILSLKEFNLEYFVNLILWQPLKKAGSMLSFITIRWLSILFLPIYLFGIYIYFNRLFIPIYIIENIPTIFTFIGMIMVFKSFSERKSPFVAFLLLIMNHFWIALAIVFNEKIETKELIFYLNGVVIAGIIGYITLLWLKKIEKKLTLNNYNGHVFEHPKLSLLFLISILGISGFPITTTFIGEDLIVSHIHKNQFLLAGFVSISFIVTGIAGIKIYARIFLGSHIKNYHEIAHKSG
jgi:NADH:ubiquinone oxidoreductase subunit 5 (subunit L)/multisubunit Na+/H+ antiporter MnhA subunit